jgi:hypothetical protein
MASLAKYRNGNYTVRIYTDGTKIRETADDEFIAEFPESMDVKITNQCDMGCPFCHEGSTPNGKHGILEHRFLDTLRPGTELAIGGGNPLSHPDLVSFLTNMKARGIICNITVNINHLDLPRLERLMSERLIWGLGVSVTRFNPIALSFARSHPNVVLHVINGVIPISDLKEYSGTKVLILGYKTFRRGKDFLSEEVRHRMDEMHRGLGNLLPLFKVVSFDNLAITQLKPERFLTPAEYDEFYMGDDGQFTMFIDLVEGKFARNSTSEERFELRDSIDEMFGIVQGRVIA